MVHVLKINIIDLLWQQTFTFLLGKNGCKPWKMSALSRVLNSFPNDELNIVFNTKDVACTVFILQKQNQFNINSNLKSS